MDWAVQASGARSRTAVPRLSLATDGAVRALEFWQSSRAEG